MIPRERVAAALAHEAADRCPFQSTFTPEFAARLRDDLGLNRRSDAGASDAGASDASASDAGASDTGAHAHNPHGGGNTYELEIALGEDLLLTSVGWANSYYQSDEHDYVDEWGVGWHVARYTTPFGVGHYTEPKGHPLADDAALSSYHAPDPARAELYADASDALARFGDRYYIVGVVVTTIFEAAWALRGLERLMMDFVRAPDRADEVLEIPFRYHLAAAERLVRMGVDMIWLGDDIGQQNGMLFSPKHWRRFLKPRMEELIRSVKGINPALKVAYHTDGDVRAVIPELIEIGIDVLNPVQPAAMDPAELKRSYGTELCFWGSMDEQQTLPFGTPDDVRREVRERIATLGAGGGLILGPTHHVQLDTPLENFWAMVEETTRVARPILPR